MNRPTPLVIIIRMLVFGVTGLCLSSGLTIAQSIKTDKDGNFASQEISIPYGFYNENFGLSAGWVYGVVGEPQDQSYLLVTGMAGTKGSGMVTVTGKDFLVPGTSRWFVDPVVSVGYFNDNDIYVNGNPAYVGERSGTNDSHEDNFVKGGGVG